MHELYVAQFLVRCLLDAVDRIRPGHLEIEPVVGARGRAIAAVAQLVIGPEAAAPEQHELLASEPAQNAFVDDLAVTVAMDDVFRLPDVELGKTVDGNIREQLERVWARSE